MLNDAENKREMNARIDGAPPDPVWVAGLLAKMATKRKPTADEILSADIAAEFSDLTPSPFDAFRATVDALQNKDRTKERNRRKRPRAPSGYRLTSGGFYVPEHKPKDPGDTEPRMRQPTAAELTMLHDLEEWLEAMSPFDPDKYTFADDEKAARWQKQRGLVSRNGMAKLRKIYEAIHGHSPEEGWIQALEGAVLQILRYAPDRRSAISKDQDHPLRHLMTGAGIVKWLRGFDPTWNVPPGLTAAKVDRLLANAALGRGGGRTQKKSYEILVAELVAELTKKPA